MYFIARALLLVSIITSLTGCEFDSKKKSLEFANVLSSHINFISTQSKELLKDLDTPIDSNPKNIDNTLKHIKKAQETINQLIIKNTKKIAKINQLKIPAQGEKLHQKTMSFLNDFNLFLNSQAKELNTIQLSASSTSEELLQANQKCQLAIKKLQEFEIKTQELNQLQKEFAKNKGFATK